MTPDQWQTLQKEILQRVENKITDAWNMTRNEYASHAADILATVTTELARLYAHAEAGRTVDSTRTPT